MSIALTVPERAQRVVASDLEINILGSCEYPSPLADRLSEAAVHYVGQADRVLLDDRLSRVSEYREDLTRAPAFELAGPRHRVFFDPAKLRCGIVSCGGLCPGLNNVIRGLVLELSQLYGVTEIVGFRNGFRGLVKGDPPIPLTPDVVRDIHNRGGTILGTSRGDQDAEAMVDTLSRLDISVLFVLGGDGTLRGAQKIVDAAAARQLALAVIGVPKTIHNDIPYIDHSFGFQTAFSRAAESIRAAHTEASSSPNGVGLVKLMGRHSGFIACYAALANHEVDFVLIPEVPFELDSEDGFLHHLHRRVTSQGHAVVVVAEGAGQHLLAGDGSRDASGNTRLADIGQLLRDRIVERFSQADADLNLRYVDPGYAIRGVQANAFDAVFCIRLAQAAVHAAMAGRTAMVVGRWHGRFVHIPISLATASRNQVDPDGDLWMSVLEASGQPPRFKKREAPW